MHLGSCVGWILFLPAGQSRANAHVPVCRPLEGMRRLWWWSWTASLNTVLISTPHLLSYFLFLSLPLISLWSSSFHSRPLSFQHKNVSWFPAKQLLVRIVNWVNAFRGPLNNIPACLCAACTLIYSLVPRSYLTVKRISFVSLALWTCCTVSSCSKGRSFIHL